eukprot:CAMPEP_0114165222 /NCGR_PEP_ID=MMETSP0043_2-20121206/31126_1 /TAXON_ID=464988 /ORGANISM="Hemiselmis andersenii, Strain CCMP644" /LENGTH=120 /DNA_ID=CAMNT_0001262015 /DNA_START=89 /DNA_END=451 /DNA_ORIENTATION=+
MKGVSMRGNPPWEGNWNFADCHFTPQHVYVIGPAGTRTCDHVLFWEALGTQFDRLMLQYGLQANITHHHHMARAENAVEFLGAGDVPDDLLDEVYRMYSTDYEMFYGDDHGYAHWKSQHH